MKIYYIIFYIFITIITSCIQEKNNSNATYNNEIRESGPSLANNLPIEQPIIIGGYAENYTLSHHRKYFNDFSVRIGENRSVDFSGIEQMKHIKTLTIIIWENNNLIDFSPIKLLPNIEKIILRGAGHAAIPDFGGIQLLRRLELDRTGLTSLNGIEKITPLEYLEISQNHEIITNTSALRFLHSLKSIVIYDTHINIDFSALGKLPELEEIIIGGGADQEIDLTGISQLKSLRKLHLYSNTARSAFAIGERCVYFNIEEIGYMNGLIELHLDETITSVEFLRNNINLESLELLADFERSDYGKVLLPLDVTPLSNLVNLKYLAIRGFELENVDFLLSSLPWVDRIIDIEAGDR
jgi:Leucine-rich repeat (LRR) protein